MRQSVQSKRVRGYRIHMYRGELYQPPSITTPLLWREQPPSRIDNERSTIQQAWIMQSGRTMKRYQFRRKAYPT